MSIKLSTGASTGGGSTVSIAGQLPLGLDAAYRDSIYVPDGVAAVALRHDDGPQTDYLITAPNLRDRFLIGGFALIGHHFLPGSAGFDGGSSSGWLTPAMAQEMQGWGMEMMNHSRTHGATPPASNTLYDDIVTNADEMRAQGLFINSFVRPGPWDGILDTDGKWDSTIGQQTRASHAAAESYLPAAFGSTAAKQKGLPVMTAYGREPFSIGGVIPLSTVQDSVEQAIGNNGAVTILIHTGGFGADGSASWVAYKAMLDYLKTERDNGRILIMTPTALNRARRGNRVNICPDPSFESLAVNSARSPWSTSSTTFPTGRLSGKAVQVGPTSGGTNCVLNINAVESLRTIEITGYAKAATTNASARIVRVSKQGATTYATRTDSFAVTTAGWTPFRVYMGMDPRAVWQGTTGVSNTVQIQLAQSTSDVLFDDIAIYKT